MALIAQPFRPSDSGIYYLRRRVPDDLRQIIGKTEIRRSLNTRHHQQAKAAFALAYAESERLFNDARQGLYVEPPVSSWHCRYSLPHRLEGLPLLSSLSAPPDLRSRLQGMSSAEDFEAGCYPLPCAFCVSKWLAGIIPSPSGMSCYAAQGVLGESVAECLNKKGVRTPRGSEFNATAVRCLMLSLNVSF